MDKIKIDRKTRMADMENFENKTFKGSKVIDLIKQLEILANQSKERAKRYRDDSHFQDSISSELHEGISQGYSDAVKRIKMEFDYPDEEK